MDIPPLIWGQRDGTMSAPVTRDAPREMMACSIIGIAIVQAEGRSEEGKPNGGGGLLTVNVRLAMKLGASRQAGQVSAVSVGWSELAVRSL